MKQAAIITISSLVLALALVGCTNSQKQTAGIAGGAVVGGLAGHALTGGSAAGTIVGAAVGGVAGNELTK